MKFSQVATTKNLRFVGAGSLLAAIGYCLIAMFDEDPATVPDFNAVILALIGLITLLTKGAANTGGTVASTEEAKARIPAKAKGFVTLRTNLLIFVTALALAFTALPARANPLVHCLSGCDPHKDLRLQLKSSGKAAALPDVPIGPTIWLGPGVAGLFVRDGASKSWEGAFAPAFTYGIKYRPAGWTATSALFALDLAVSLGLNSSATPQHFDVIPVFTLLNTISVGGGARFRLASDPSQADDVSFLLAIGIGPALGSP